MSTSAASVCTHCIPGRYSPSRASACTACTLGRYANGSSYSACRHCPKGTHTPTEAAPVCTACAAGQYGAVPGLSVCQSCQVATYTPLEGLTRCLECAPGQYRGGLGQVGLAYHLNFFSPCLLLDCMYQLPSRHVHQCGVPRLPQTTTASPCLCRLPQAHAPSVQWAHG